MPAVPTIASPHEATRPFFLGIDLGGTSVKLGIVDSLGSTLARSKIDTDHERGPEDGVARMAAAAKKLIQDAGLTKHDIAWAGLASPGTMDIPAGMLLEPPNLVGWEDFPIRDRLSNLLGLPLAFANDANAASYGEFWIGAAKEDISLVMLTLGTGVGGGIIVYDKSIDGEHSHGSECGHIIIDYRDEARLCPCGHRGHLEAYCSAKSVVARLEESLAAGAKSSLAALQASGEELTALAVYKAADAGDELAQKLIDETAAYLGVGIVTLIHTIDPAIVVLGGAMNFGGPNAKIGKRFLDRIRQEVLRRALPVPARLVKIDFASLGGNAGYIGAAGIARLAYLKDYGTHH